MTPEAQVKLFHMTNALLNTDLDEVEKAFDIDLGRTARVPEGREGTYLQFAASIRAEAESMAKHYELFYCLENSIRELVSARLFSAFGEAWWNKVVPDAVKENVKRNIEREREAGVTLRSAETIDYTTFGELGEIIQFNWDIFSDTFNNRKALAKVLSGLNHLRAPIAHCSPLAADEITRLELALRDWFRLME